MSDRFDWHRDNPDVLFRSYGDVAMYLNPYGDVVVRQNDPFDTDDSIVIIPVANADAFAQRFKELVDESRRYDWRPEGEPNVATPAPRQEERQPRLALPPPAVHGLNGARERHKPAVGHG